MIDKTLHASWCNGNTFSSCEKVSGSIPLFATNTRTLNLFNGKSCRPSYWYWVKGFSQNINPNFYLEVWQSWSIARVLKTRDRRRPVGSNPTASAGSINRLWNLIFHNLFFINNFLKTISKVALFLQYIR